MKPSFICLFFVIENTLYAQSIVVDIGDNYMINKTNVPITNQGNALDNTSFMGLYLENLFTINSLSFSLPDYRGERYLKLDGGFQIVPTVGFNIKWNPIWWVVLKLDYHFTYGFRPFQRLYHFYEYKGVPQPTAEWYSDGTAHFVSIGIGFRIEDKWKC